MTRLALLLAIGIALFAEDAKLRETQWRLKSVDGKAYTPGKGQKKPYLILREKESKLIGFSGCNRMNGDYKLKGADLSFGPTMGTKMACETGMEIEKSFTMALPRVKHWKVAGQELQLLDAGGKAVAQFAAVPKE